MTASSPASALAYGPDPLQFGELSLPSSPGPHPVVIVVHGGYWHAQYDLSYLRPLCRALVEAGWATWNVEYRRLGNRGGGWPGTFQDVAEAADHLRELAPAHELDLRRVVALGHSAGGHLAAWLAARQRIPATSPLHRSTPLQLHAVVALAGVLDLRNAWRLRLGGGMVRALVGGTPEEVPERYHAGSPAELLPLGVRQILVHGTADEAVPFEVSQAYYDKALPKGDPVRLVRQVNAGHFELVNPDTPQGEEVVQVVATLRD